ncbi:DUF5590 domain-containing protein [Virgibacillus sp. YIM 98842]|jgi:uncharacterized protein YpmB|uniref:cell wall elongation regulator TseB-like domain-containing protein n=1 Tax=Virgibacillus sp. YIM 98842 TaxID=2663533 RepID=UPI0013D8FE95|nr:DUF5590 domain-containing protein [Virgibacillus sp. YIM 98842]
MDNETSTVKKFFKWAGFSLVILFISAAVYSIFLYQDIMGDKTDNFAETESQILDATSLVSIDKMEQFNGADAYHVVFGENDANENKIIFYPLEGQEKNLTILDESEIVSEETILSLWSESCSECDLIKAVPAIVDENVLWELTYVDESDRYILDYVSIYDGSRYEQYRFTQIFN